jgi:hypothetical protein
MSDALLLEFSGVSADQYREVNSILGIDPETGGGDWPDGLQSHTGALNGDSFLVFEVWDSQQSQEAFMSSRLGPALGQGGVGQPSRMEWFSVLGHANP